MCSHHVSVQWRDAHAPCLGAMARSFVHLGVSLRAVRLSHVSPLQGFFVSRGCVALAQSGALGYALPRLSGRLAAGPPDCHCHCRFDAEPSAGVLSLLGTQLERCGPERLGPAPRPQRVAIFAWGLVALWALTLQRRGREAPLVRVLSEPASPVVEGALGLRRRPLARLEGGGRGQIVTA